MKNLGKLNKNLLLINLFFLQSYLIRFSFSWPIFYRSNLMEILIGLQLILFILWKIKTKSLIKTIKNIKKHWPLIVITVLSGLSLLFNEIVDTIAALRHIKFLIFSVILAFIFLETFKKSSQKSKGINYLGYGAIGFGIFSLIYNLSGYNVAHDLRLQGPLNSAVYLAYYLSPFFIWFSIKFFENIRIKKNLFLAVSLLLLLIGTRSMGAIGGNLLILCIYLVLKHRQRLLKSYTAKAGLIIIVLTTVVVTFYSKILPTLQTEYSSLDERGEIWKTSIEVLTEPRNMIFGLGYGQFQDYYFKNVETVLDREPLDYYVLQPHNIFLIFLSHYGIAGLIFILYCLYLNLNNIIYNKKISVLPLRLNFILLYFFIHGLIDTPIFKNDLLFIFLLFLEMAINYRKPVTKSNKAV